MKGILNRGINRIELVNNIRENGEGIEINKNYINKLKKEVSYEEALMFLCMSTLEIYGLDKEIDKLNNIIKEAIEYHNNCIEENLDLDKIDDNEKLAYKVAYEIHNKYIKILDKGE